PLSSPLFPYTTLFRSLLSIAAFVTGALLGGCKDKSHTTWPPLPLVEVVTVTQADVPLYHEWIGVLDGLVNAHIRAQVTGYLVSRSEEHTSELQSRGHL